MANSGLTRDLEADSYKAFEYENVDSDSKFDNANIRQDQEQELNGTGPNQEGIVIVWECWNCILI
jgi:hypothetical protein